MDLSLEEIIKAKKGARSRARGRGSSRGRRGGRGGSLGRGQSSAKGGGEGAKPNRRSSLALVGLGRGQGSAKGGGEGAKPNRQSTVTGQSRGRQRRGGGGRGRGGRQDGGLVKLMISNLDYGVSNDDVKELFAEFGRVVRSEVHYDKNGRSLGTATVVYSKMQDAQKAVKQYHNVPLDGRPMTIQVISDQMQLAKSSTSVKQRVDVKQQGQEGSVRGRGKGSGRGKGTGRGRGAKTPAPTAEELDADLDTYKKAETMDT